MKNVLTTAVLLLSLSAPVLAQNPIDNNVKAALYDIDRAEQQINGVKSNQASKLKRIVRMIDSAKSQLQSSSNQDHETWHSASTRLEALDARIVTIKAPQPADPAPATKTAAVQAPQPVDPAIANQQSNADMGLLGSIDRRTDGLIREINEYERADYTRLQSKLQTMINNLKGEYNQLQNPTHPVAITVAQKVLAVEKRIHDEIAALAAQEQSFGDVISRVAEIQQRISPDNRSWFGSPVPDAPYNHEVVHTFAQQMNRWKSATEQDLAYLESVKDTTQRVNVPDMIQKLQHDLSSIDTFNETLAGKIEKLLSGIDQIDTFVEKVPSDRIEFEVSRLQSGIEMADTLANFNNTTGRSAQPGDDRKHRYATNIDALQAKAMAAVADSRFPQIRSENPELLAAAKEVLSRPEYPVNPIQRMAITYDMQRKSTSEGEIDWGAVSTTVTVTDYEWDEFAVTTVEEVNGQYFMFYNEFKFFHSGGTDVPTGKWTLGRRHQSMPILQQNINL